MGVLQRFERRVESVVSGAFARVFKSEVQPVELAGALQRECDARAAIVSRGRTMVPNVFTVDLSPHDHGRLAPYCEPLCRELADLVAEHAAETGYTFVGPVSVRLERDDALATGVFHVRSNAIAGTGGGAGRAPVEPERDAVRRPAAVAEPPNGGVARPPYSPPALDVAGMRVTLTAPVTVLGRGEDADVRIDDPGVSRRHAEVRLHPQAADAALVVDLGSTNGVVVDGRRVPRAELRDGDAVVLGSTRLVFHAGAG